MHEIVGELKSGKEATVYLGTSPAGPVAVKIHRDVEVRSFKDDRRYQEGRFIGDARLAKAIRLRSGRGLRALKALWAAHEYLILWRLFEAGLSVPEPLVGPDAFDLTDAGEVVLMRFVGDPDDPAQRLADATLSPAEAQDAAAVQRYGIAANQAASNASGLYQLAGSAMMAFSCGSRWLK